MNTENFVIVSGNGAEIYGDSSSRELKIELPVLFLKV